MEYRIGDNCHFLWAPYVNCMNTCTMNVHNCCTNCTTWAGKHSIFAYVDSVLDTSVEASSFTKSLSSLHHKQRLSISLFKCRSSLDNVKTLNYRYDPFTPYSGLPSIQNYLSMLVYSENVCRRSTCKQVSTWEMTDLNETYVRLMYVQLPSSCAGSSTR